MEAATLKKSKILYVDDEKASLAGFKSVFRDHYDVYTASSPEEAYGILKQKDISIVISDQRMPEETGTQFLQRIKVEYPETVRMIITGYSDINAVIEAINKSMVYYYFSKPFDTEDMKMIMDNAVEKLRLQKQNRELIEKLSQTVNELKEKKDWLEQEIEQRKAAEKEVKNLNDELLIIDKAKADFLRIMSHEIRTPLNGIIGPFQLIKDEVKDANLNEILEILDYSVDRLERFAASAMKITDLQTKTYKLKLEEINLRESIDFILSNNKSLFTKKKISFRLDLPDKGVFIKADRELYAICLRGIIENALKHSLPNSEIKIIAIENTNGFEIEVRDQGRGFDKEVLDKYNMFKNKEDKYFISNIGYNMSLSKLIIEAHSGTMNISNHPEGGAVVKIICPKK